MKILIYGAGVIGSIYAAKLYEAGYNVTLLARGERYNSLKRNGVIVNDVLTGKQTIYNVPLTQQLETEDFYDIIIVTVRADQINAIVSFLKGNTICPLIMFMFNNIERIERLTNELNHKHIILGFPGVGGAYRDNFIEYIQIKQQKTTIGEISGDISVLIKDIRTLLQSAGFKVKISANIRAWLKTHALFIACVSASIMKENGDSIRLGKNKRSVEIMVKSIREGFIACKALGIPIAPLNLKIIFMIMPQWFSVLYWQKAMRGQIGTLTMAPHVNAAKDEMQFLAKKVLTIIHSSPVSTPTLDNLLESFINLK